MDRETEQLHSELVERPYKAITLSDLVFNQLEITRSLDIIERQTQVVLLHYSELVSLFQA